MHVQCSCYTAARQLADFAWSVIREGWVIYEVALLCVPILIEGITGPDWLLQLPFHERRSLKIALRRASLLYYQIPHLHSHIDRAFGRAYWQLGKQRKAIRNFEKAVQLSEQKGMKYQQAKSLLDLAAVKEEGREQNRAQGIELLKEMKSVIPRAGDAVSKQRARNTRLKYRPEDSQPDGWLRWSYRSPGFMHRPAPWCDGPGD